MIDAIRAHALPNPPSEAAAYHHENGTRRFDRDMENYAHIYGVNAQWLNYGTGPMRPAPQTLRASGQIGPQGLVKTGSNMPESLVESPPMPGNYLAFTVDDDHNFPALLPGSVVYTQPFGPPTRALGRLCIARLSDDTLHLCVLSHGSHPDHFGLIWINAAPRPDTRVYEAALVAWTRSPD